MLFRSVTNSNHRRDPSQAVLWVPPPAGKVLINVDASLFANSMSMAAGVMIRDHSGSCIAACCVGSPDVVNPELAEAIAVRTALVFALEEGLENVSVATDCLSVVQRIVSTNLDRSTCGPVIKDIKQLCASFTACSIYHVRREQNVAAHLLARSCNQLVCSVWRGVPPECIREAICNDSLSL